MRPDHQESENPGQVVRELNARYRICLTGTPLENNLGELWSLFDFLLPGMVSGESSFPRRLRLKGPTSAQMAEQFDSVRTWIAELRALPHYRLEMLELRHRQLGANEVPESVWVDTLDDALDLLGKHRQARQFATLVERTRERRPLLLEWIARRPLKTLELADAWDRLRDVVGWVESHPRPGVYLRQVDIPGVHSKFIEAHRGAF